MPCKEREKAEAPPLVFICSPLKGDMEANMQRANRYCRFAAWQGVVPLAPHTIFTQYLDDENEEERAAGRYLGLQLLKKCDELWCFGERISEGMKAEITLAKKRGIRVLYFTDRCERRVI